MDIQIKWFYRLGFMLLLFVVIFLFWKLKSLWLPVLVGSLKIISPFLIAAFITYLLNPIIEKVHVLGLHRGLAAFLIYALFFGGLGFALYKGTPLFIEELSEFSKTVPMFTNQYLFWIDNIQYEASAWPIGVQERINDAIVMLEVSADRLATKIMEGVFNLANTSLLIALIPFISFYMIKDYSLLKKTLSQMTPMKWHVKGMRFLKDVDKSLGAYIRGQLILCIVIGVLSALLFWMIGLKYALLLGMMIGITNVIPYFGPLIGALPAVMVAATISYKMVIFVVVIVAALQFIEGNVLGPIIVGKTLQMHPLVIIFALVLGGEIGGVIGLILIVPLFAICKIAIVHARNYKMTVTRPIVGEND